ncbi:Gti1/Pac2 family-domain-containing protein, partial [Panaeolus papilionaceus]
QPPTLHPYRVQTPEEALIIFHAVYLGVLRMVSRRLDADERRAIHPGCVYVWEERGQSSDNSVGLGIERWTDSIQWGPSRVRDEFLYYRERRSPTAHEFDQLSDSAYPYRPPLVKQTYSVYVNTPNGRRKWHLIAYLTEEQHTHRDLYTVWNNPELSRIKIPEGMYQCARVSRKNLRSHSNAAHLREQQAAAALHSASWSHEPTIQRELESPPESQIPTISRDDSATPDSTHTNGYRLAPLEFLKTVSPPKRHALDEMALIRL